MRRLPRIARPFFTRWVDQKTSYSSMTGSKLKTPLCDVRPVIAKKKDENKKDASYSLPLNVRINGGVFIFDAITFYKYIFRRPHTIRNCSFMTGNQVHSLRRSSWAKLVDVPGKRGLLVGANTCCWLVPVSWMIWMKLKDTGLSEIERHNR